MAIPLAWQLSMQGSAAVKQEFRDIQNELQKTGHWTEDLAKRQRSAEQAARISVQTHTRLKNVYLATHPTLLTLTRATSVFGSVMRSAQSALNTYALTQMLLRGSTSQTAKVQAELNQLRREEADLIEKGQVGTKKWLENQDDINVKLKELEEVTNQEQQDKLTAYFGIFTGAAVTFATMVKAVPEMKAGLTSLMKHMGSLGGKNIAGGALIAAGGGLLATGGLDAIIGKSNKIEDKLKAIGATAAIGVGLALIFPEAAKFILIGTVIATATIAIIVFRKELGDFIQWVGTALGVDFLKVWEDVTAKLQGFWETITTGFSNFWNGLKGIFQNIANDVLKGVEGFINKFIEAINFLISRYNALPGRFKIFGNITPLKQISIAPLDLGGGGATQSQQGVSPATHPWLGSAGGAVTNNIIVQGSIWSKEEFNKAVGESLKSQLLQRGFQ